MKSVRKGLLIMLAVIQALSLSACGGAGERGDGDESPGSVTSREAGLYTAVLEGKETVVDSYGTVKKGYAMDEDGNITRDGEIVIARRDTEEYRYVRSIISLMTSDTVDVKLTQTVKEGTVDETATVPCIVEYRVYVSPADASHPELEVTSDDPETVEPVNAVGEEAKAIVEPEEGMAVLSLRCRKEGTAKIRVKATDNSGESFELTLNVGLKELETPVTGNTVINQITVQNGKVWTKADSSGIVRLHEKPDETSTALNAFIGGKEVTVTGNMNGWYRCSVDGVTGYIKADNLTFTKPEETQITQTTTQTGVTTTDTTSSKNDGKDHGNAVGAEHEETLKKESETGENHIHCYEKYLVMEAAPGQKGYTEYRCSCGACYRTNYTEYTE